MNPTPSIDWLRTAVSDGVAIEPVLFDRIIREAREDALRTARSVVVQYLSTAELWRYDTVCWAFSVMLGEIPEDTPPPTYDRATVLTSDPAWEAVKEGIVYGHRYTEEDR